MRSTGMTYEMDAAAIARLDAYFAQIGAHLRDKRWSGNRGGGIKLASLAKNCIGILARCVAPLRLGLRRRYATRPSARIDRRSKPHFGRAP